METVRLRDALWRCARAHALVDPVDTTEEANARASFLYAASPTSHLGMAARVRGFDRAMLDGALHERRSLVRIPAMRGSVYLLPPPLVASGLSLAANSAGARGIPATLERAGLSGSTQGRLIASIEALLREGPKTAAELRAGLKGWREPAPGMLQLLLRYLGMRGRIVATRARGTWKSQLHEYALLRDWVDVPPRFPTVEKALEKLTPVYFNANGPATVADFAWWAGVPEATAKAAVEAAELQPVFVDKLQGIHYATTASLNDLARAAEGSLALLPHWDAYVMAHQERRRYLDPKWRDRVVDRSGNVTSVVLKDGRVVGVWGWRNDALKFAPFEPLNMRVVREAAGPIMSLLELRDVVEAKPPGPLEARGENAFLSPIP